MTILNNSSDVISHRLFSYEELLKLSDFTHPCIIQQFIEKEFEIRVFFIGEKLYSAALFFENNTLFPDYKDLLNYSDIAIIPFKLPYTIEVKIKKFMKKLNLNIGCIDLIKTRAGDYYFLEVNHSGQFSNISVQCNYFLEQKIAYKLIRNKVK